MFKVMKTFKTEGFLRGRNLKFTEQFNKVTSFIDASVVYGPNEVRIQN